LPASSEHPPDAGVERLSVAAGAVASVFPFAGCRIAAASDRQRASLADAGALSASGRALLGRFGIANLWLGGKRPVLLSCRRLSLGLRDALAVVIQHLAALARKSHALIADRPEAAFAHQRTDAPLLRLDRVERVEARERHVEGSPGVSVERGQRSPRDGIPGALSGCCETADAAQFKLDQLADVRRRLGGLARRRGERGNVRAAFAGLDGGGRPLLLSRAGTIGSEASLILFGRLAFCDSRSPSLLGRDAVHLAFGEARIKAIGILRQESSPDRSGPDLER